MKNNNTKKEFIKKIKSINWFQVLINAAVIYIVCHLILKIF